MSLANLITRAQQVKNEVLEGANSANRVGGLVEDVILMLDTMSQTITQLQADVQYLQTNPFFGETVMVYGKTFIDHSNSPYFEADAGKVLIVDASTSSIEITLPEITEIMDGLWVDFYIRGAQGVYIIGAVGDTVAGGANVFIGGNSSFRLVADYDTGNWVDLFHSLTTIQPS